MLFVLPMLIIYAPGLTDDQADARMQRVLATVMVLNRLQDVELTDVEELYLPSVEHFETALSTRKMRRSIQAFLIRDPELASSVEEAAVLPSTRLSISVRIHCLPKV